MDFAFVLYPGVEPIDLAAIGVLSMARRVRPQLRCLTVAAQPGLVELASGLRVAADTGFADCPPVDAVIVPGGPGWRRACDDAALRDFLRRRAPDALLVSLCTGAMILAAAGLLDGLPATTKVEVVPPETSPLDELRARHPAVQARGALLVDCGRVVTGGGVALCIDTMLHVLATRVDDAAAAEAARILEYGAAVQANAGRLATVVVPASATG